MFKGWYESDMLNWINYTLYKRIHIVHVAIEPVGVQEQLQISLYVLLHEHIFLWLLSRKCKLLLGLIWIIIVCFLNFFFFLTL